MAATFIGAAGRAHRGGPLPALGGSDRLACSCDLALPDGEDQGLRQPLSPAGSGPPAAGTGLRVLRPSCARVLSAGNPRARAGHSSSPTRRAGRACACARARAARLARPWPAGSPPVARPPAVCTPAVKCVSPRTHPSDKTWEGSGWSVPRGGFPTGPPEGGPQNHSRRGLRTPPRLPDQPWTQRPHGERPGRLEGLGPGLSPVNPQVTLRGRPPPPRTARGAGQCLAPPRAQ